MRTHRTATIAAATLILAGLANGTARASSGHPSWVWPVSPHTVTRVFHRPPHNWLPGHRGVDLAGHAGDPVRAAGAGRVVFAGVLAGKGVVVVSHGSLRTTYEPVAAQVAVGQRVAAGQVIGHLAAGESHCSTGDNVECLHWGLRRGRRYLDPLALVTRHPRLLPQQ